MTTLDTVDSQTLVDRYYPVFIARANKLVKRLKRKGINADLDQLESDAGLWLTKAVKKYQDMQKEKPFFDMVVRKWEFSKVSKFKRDSTTKRKVHMESLPEDFDKVDRKAVLWEGVDLEDCPYPEVVERVLSGDTLEEVQEELGISRYEMDKSIRPELMRYFGPEH